MGKSKVRAVLLASLIILVIFNILLFILDKYYLISLAGKYTFLLIQLGLVIILFTLFKNKISRVLCILGSAVIFFCINFVSEMGEYKYSSPSKEYTIIVQELPSLKGVNHIVYERKYGVFKKCIPTANVDTTYMGEPFKNNKTMITWSGNTVKIEYFDGHMWKKETINFRNELEHNYYINV